MAWYIFNSTICGIRICKNWKPDLVHAHFAVPAGAAAFVLSKLFHIPYMITAHGGDVPGGAPEKTKKWFKFVFPFSKTIWKNARKVTTVSTRTKELAQRYYPVDCIVIPNGIDIRKYSPRETSLHSPPSILFIGRFSPEKNAVAIPKILASLKDIQWTCTMLGDGPQLAPVKELVRQYNLTDRIQLTGWVPPEKIPIFLHRSDILIIPSLREAMPMAGLQGLAAGLAIISSDVGSCRDLVLEDRNGYLLEPNRIAAFTSKLKSLLENPGKIMVFKNNSRRHVSNFDISKSMHAYGKVYQSIHSKQG